MRSERSRLEQDAAGDGSDSREALAKRLGVRPAELGVMELRMAARDFSLDAPLTEDTGSSHVDLLADADEDIFNQDSAGDDKLDLLHVQIVWKPI